MKQPGRKIFQHDVPPWVDPDASEYFITICCKQRGTNQLCTSDIGEALLESARFYHQQQKWFSWVFLLMPDHVHMIVGFPQPLRIEAVVSAWKRFTATRYEIIWQQGFFEHRLRRNESAEEKADYILRNPVRAGLITEGKDWPYLLVVRAGGTPENLGSASERHPYLVDDGSCAA